MKILLRVISLTLFATLVLFACKKEYSQEGGNGPNPIDTTNGPPVPAEWEFTQNGIRYHGPVDTAFLSVQGNGQIIIATGSSGNSSEQIYLYIRSISGPIRAGETYATTQEQLKFTYKNGQQTIFSAIPAMGGEIYLTVTSVADDRIVGTFNGLARDANGRPAQIVDGKFSSPLKKAPAGAETGSVIFWAKEMCEEKITLRLNNQDKEITATTNTPPVCGDDGHATYNLPPGQYQWKAYGCSDTLAGMIDITANNCKNIRIEFPFRPTDTTFTDVDLTCKISKVSYNGCLLTPCFSGASGPVANTISATFTGSQATSLLYDASFNGTLISFEHPVNYGGGRVTIDANTANQQYFDLDAQGRVIGFNGFTRPYVLFPMATVKTAYEYNASGRMSKRTVMNPANNNVRAVSNFNWSSDGLLQSIEEFYPGSGTSKKTTYTYFDTKPVTKLPFFNLEMLELVMFQPAIDLGLQSGKAPKTIVYDSYDASGNRMSHVEHNFANYNIDGNKYVYGLRQRDPYDYSTFSFDYHCF